MDKDQLANILEALIFASDGPLTLSQMTSIVENVEKTDVEQAIEVLNNNLYNRPFMLKKVAGGYEFATRPEYSKYIKKMYDGKARSRLTRAALESLSIIAFKQPISKVEVSAIRGVNSDGVIKGLLERGLITISGRDQGPGRPLLFGTTKEFLRYFGINDISDLPKPKEIEQLLAEGEAGKIMEEISEEALYEESESDKESETQSHEKSGAQPEAAAEAPNPEKNVTNVGNDQVE